MNFDLDGEDLDDIDTQVCCTFNYRSKNSITINGLLLNIGHQS